MREIIFIDRSYYSKLFDNILLYSRYIVEQFIFVNQIFLALDAFKTIRTLN